MTVAPKVKCLKCGDEIQSQHRHDFVECSCGNIFVDGGTDYFRYGGSALTDGSVHIWNEISEKWEPLLGDEDANTNIPTTQCKWRRIPSLLRQLADFLERWGCGTDNSR